MVLFAFMNFYGIKLCYKSQQFMRMKCQDCDGMNFTFKFCLAYVTLCLFSIAIAPDFEC